MSETRGLGRGLSSLIGDGASQRPKDGQRKVAIGDLRPGRLQPRTRFDDNDIATLAASIREHGLLQPIVARAVPGEPGALEIVAGERRWRAAQKAKLHEVPVIVRELEDRDVLEIALIENLQRADLNPLEEAHAYRRLVKEFGLTQEEVADAVGRSRPHIANMTRLLGLPDLVQTMIAEGQLSAGQARPLLAAAHPIQLAREIVERGLSAREAEALARDGGGKGAARKRKAQAAEPDPDIRDLERRLGETTGLKVTVKSKGEKGELVLAYTSLDQLDDVIARLESPPRPRLVQS